MALQPTQLSIEDSRPLWAMIICFLLTAVGNESARLSWQRLFQNPGWAHEAGGRSLIQPLCSVVFKPAAQGGVSRILGWWERRTAGRRGRWRNQLTKRRVTRASREKIRKGPRCFLPNLEQSWAKQSGQVRVKRIIVSAVITPARHWQAALYGCARCAPHKSPQARVVNWSWDQYGLGLPKEGGPFH